MIKTIITKQIRRDEFIIIFSEIIGLVKKYWGEELKGAHGGVSNVDDDKQFNYKIIKTKDIINKLEKEEELENFIIGEWDYFLTNIKETETIQLCHESDIHFEIEEDFTMALKEKLNGLQIEYFE